MMSRSSLAGQPSEYRWVRRFAAMPILLLLILAGVVTPRSKKPPSNQVSDTRFNYKRGFYTSGIKVLIQSKTRGARIRYTLDGSAPTPSSGWGDTNPVVIPIETTTVLRALAYKDGMLPSNVDTHTYIFPEDVIRQPARIPGYPNPNIRIESSGPEVTVSIWGKAGFIGGKTGKAARDRLPLSSSTRAMPIVTSRWTLLWKATADSWSSGPSV